MSATTDPQALAELAGRTLYARDPATRALGIELLAMAPGSAQMRMLVRPDMLNGYATCHGGLIFALADSAFAFSCNSHDASAVAAAASIDFLAPAREGDVLTAVALELWRSGRSGLYEITVSNQRGERIALFRGRAQRISGTVTAPATATE
jgi:acyl-CoA thioesterase